MQKDFKTWHKKKAEIEIIEKRPFFHEREIWFCSFGANVGFEQDGRGEDFIRPVVVLKKFNNEIFWAIPLTKSKRSGNKKVAKYYYQFSFVDGVESSAIISQLRLIDARRLARQIGVMSESEFGQLKEKLKALLP